MDAALAADPTLWLKINVKGHVTDARNQIVVDSIVGGAPFPVNEYYNVFARYWVYASDGPIGDVHDDVDDKTGVYLSPAAIQVFAQNARCYVHLPNSARTELNVLRALVQGNMLENVATFGRLRLNHFFENVNPFEILFMKLTSCGRFADVRSNPIWIELRGNDIFRHMPLIIDEEEPFAEYDLVAIDAFLKSAKKQLRRAKRPIPSVQHLLGEIIAARSDLTQCVYFSSFKMPADCWSSVCDFLTHRIPLPLLRELEQLSVQLRDPTFLKRHQLPPFTRCFI